MWINQNCNNLYNALKRRLECLERETDPSKKELLLIGYYGCLEKYFQSNMYDLLMEISRRKRKNSQEMYIRALVKKQGDKMSNEIIELLKKKKNLSSYWLYKTISFPHSLFFLPSTHTNTHT